MSNTTLIENPNIATTDGARASAPDALGRMSIPEIAQRLAIGRMAVYEMLETGIIPGIRLGRRWIVTRFAYEEWERVCGKRDTF